MTARDRLPVQIGARKYAAEIPAIEFLPHGDIANVFDDQAEPSERSLENRGIWKRTQEDWSLGAGQRYFDLRSDLDPSKRERFRWSRGLDLFSERRTCKLLNSVTLQATIGNGDTGKSAVVNGYMYIASGVTVQRSDQNDLTTWTNCTGESGTDITDMLTYGGTIYICDGASVLELDGATGALAFASFSTIDTDYMIAGAGRHFGMELNGFWEFAAAGAKRNGVNIHDHFDTNFVWRGGIVAPNGVYIFGDATDVSEVYFMTASDATGDIANPTPVLSDIPPGEFIRSMHQYAGTMILCTSRGVRLAPVLTGGVLSMGPLIPLGDVLDMATGFGERGELAICGYSDMLDSSGVADDSGVAFIKLDKFADDLLPSWSSGYAIGVGGLTTRFVEYFDGVCVFGSDNTTSLSIVVQDTDTLVESGELRVGGITFGVAEQVALSSVELDTDPLPVGASIEPVLHHRVESSNAETLEIHSSAKKSNYIDRITQELVLEEPELKLTLNRGTTTSEGPSLRRWTLRVIPMIRHSEVITIPIMLADTVSDGDEGHDIRHKDVLEELLYLRDLKHSNSIIECGIADFKFLGRIRAVMVAPGRLGPGLEQLEEMQRDFAAGTWYVQIETLSDAAGSSL